MSVGNIAHFITNKNKRIESCGFVAEKPPDHSVRGQRVALYNRLSIDCRPNVVIFEELSDGSVRSVCGVLRRAVFDYSRMSVVVSRALCLRR